MLSPLGSPSPRPAPSLRSVLQTEPEKPGLQGSSALVFSRLSGDARELGDALAEEQVGTSPAVRTAQAEEACLHLWLLFL